jgi:hypothetical protein
MEWPMIEALAVSPQHDGAALQQEGACQGTSFPTPTLEVPKINIIDQGQYNVTRISPCLFLVQPISCSSHIPRIRSRDHVDQSRCPQRWQRRLQGVNCPQTLQLSYQC